AVCLEDTDDPVEVPGRHAGTAPDTRRRAVRAGHVGVGAVVHIEQAALGRLEQDAPTVAEGLVQEAGGVGDVRAPLGGVAEVLGAPLVGVEGARVGRAGAQQAVLALHDLPQAVEQVVGVQQLLDADGVGAAGLVLVTGADAAAGGADAALAPLLVEALFFQV